MKTILLVGNCCDVISNREVSYDQAQMVSKFCHSWSYICNRTNLVAYLSYHRNYKTKLPFYELKMT